jgi:hypothetical protein
MSHTLGLLARSALALTLFSALAVGSGCRGGDGTGGGGSSSDGGTDEGGNPSTGAGTEGGNNEGGAPVAGCEGPTATIEEITTGNFGPGSKVSVGGVVAMSQKFLVSKSSTTDSCLWGVFVSAPGLSETGPNTGILALSYGFKASIPEGGDTAFCPRLGQDEVGDKIPDNVKPGDVLDVIGTVSRFPDPPNCEAPNPPNQVGMLQLSSVCQANLVGTAPVPAAHVLTAEEIEGIQSTSDKTFHDQWGAVKVRMEGVAPDTTAGAVVGDFGIIKLTNGIELGDKIYYRGYSNNYCHEAPVYTDTSVMFDYVEGFHYLAFCTWGIQPNDKCADLSPSSEDCTAAVCQPDTI